MSAFHLRVLACIGLGLPAVVLGVRAWGTPLAWMDVTAPMGLWALRWTVLALLLGPLYEALDQPRWLRLGLQVRRQVGIAAGLYALLHFAAYLIDLQQPASWWDEFTHLTSIQVGWLALLVLLVPWAISSNRAMRILGVRWKRLQRLVYPALGLGVAHWLLIGWQRIDVVSSIAPLLLAWAGRWWRRCPTHKEHIA